MQTVDMAEHLDQFHNSIGLEYAGGREINLFLQNPCHILAQRGKGLVKILEALNVAEALNNVERGICYFFGELGVLIGNDVSSFGPELVDSHDHFNVDVHDGTGEEKFFVGFEFAMGTFLLERSLTWCALCIGG
jgi:hypothetical protein